MARRGLKLSLNYASQQAGREPAFRLAGLAGVNLITVPMSRHAFHEAI